MKKIFYTLILILIVNFVNSQTTTSTVIIYSQTGENFQIYLNNILQNDTAKSNVTCNNLNLSVYSLKIQFEDIYVEAFTKTLYLNPASISTYVIKKKANGKYKLWPVSQTTANPVVNNGTNLNLNNLGNILYTIEDIANSNNYSDNGFSNGNKPSGCSPNVDNYNFDNVKQSIASKTFEADKLSLAKQFAGSNCLKAIQVRDIMKLFAFEDSKIEFAKYAYHHTSDFTNYSIVYEAFTYSTSKDDINRYINSLH